MSRAKYSPYHSALDIGEEFMCRLCKGGKEVHVEPTVSQCPISKVCYTTEFQSEKKVGGSLYIIRIDVIIP